MLFRALLALSAAAILAGCAHTNASMLGTPGQRPEIPAEQVALYRTAEQVPGRYEEVALLNSTGDSGFTSEQGMFESMRRRAGKVGANAIILDAITEPTSGAKVAAAIFGVSAQRKGRALAIYVLPDQTAAPVAAARAVAAPTTTTVASGNVSLAPVAGTTSGNTQTITTTEHDGYLDEAVGFARSYRCDTATVTLVTKESDRETFKATCPSGPIQIECWAGICRLM